MTGKSLLRAAALAAALVPASTSLSGQNPIACPQGFKDSATPGACLGTLPASADGVVLSVPIKADTGAVVRFRVASGGGAVLPDSVRLGADGTASTFWSRPRSETPAVVLVEVISKAGNAIRALELGSGPVDNKKAARIQGHSGGGQDWFERRQLRFPLVAQITQSNDTTAITDPAVCSRYRVVFQRAAQSGSATLLPDTAPARLGRRGIGWTPSERNREGCFAFGSATLGEGVGPRYFDATLLGPQVALEKNRVLFSAHGRALPRFVTALGLTQIRKVPVLESGTERKGKVTRVFTMDSTRIEVDTTITGAASVGKDGGTEPVAVLGVTTPIPSPWWMRQRLNVMVGVDPVRPASSIFGGGLPRELAFRLRWRVAPARALRRGQLPADQDAR